MSYCIFGWLFESAYCSLKSGHLQNRGFCHGPWIPLYGTGATLLVMLAGPYRSNPLLVFLIGVLGGTLLELVTGFVMEKLFQMRWWDYSQNPFNFHGYICLYASLGWGFLAMFIIDHVHPIVERISENWSYSTFLVVNTMLYTLFVEDTVFSAIAALDLKKRLRTLAENSEEIQRLRLSIQDAYARLEDAKRELDMGIESMQDIRKTEGNVAAARVAVQETMKAVREGAGIAEGKVRDMAESSVSNVKSLSEDARKALLLQKESMERRLSLLLDGGNESMSPMNWWTKTMLRNNPDAVSKEPTFGMLRAAALKRKEKKEEEKGRASRKREKAVKERKSTMQGH